jgi:cytochrome c553
MDAQVLSSSPERLTEMRHHFSQVLSIHEAIVRGDLAGVREPATELVYLSVPPGFPAIAGPYGTAIRAAGRRAASATTLPEAARAAVSMIRECANCHRAVGVVPAPAPPAADGPMSGHRRAADELLLGMLIPSAAKWAEGAERLRIAAHGPGRLSSDPGLAPDIRRAQEALRRLADQAVEAVTPAARASTYVQLLTTCAECHGVNRTLRGPRAGP